MLSSFSVEPSVNVFSICFVTNFIFRFLLSFYWKRRYICLILFFWLCFFTRCFGFYFSRCFFFHFISFNINLHTRSETNWNTSFYQKKVFLLYIYEFFYILSIVSLLSDFKWDKKKLRVQWDCSDSKWNHL